MMHDVDGRSRLVQNIVTYARSRAKALAQKNT